MSIIELPWGAEIHLEGGPAILVLLAAIAALLTVIIGIWVAIVIYQKYRRSGERPHLYLTGGIMLVAPIHTLLRITLAGVDHTFIVTNSAAASSQLIGLGLILYAIYGRPEELEHRHPALIVAVIAVLLVLIGGLLALGPNRMTDQAIMGMSAIVAMAGLFVAIQAFRGYRRHRSTPMLFLSLGIAFLTVLPFVITLSSWVLPDVPSIGFGVLGISSEVIGLFAILYSFTHA